MRIRVAVTFFAIFLALPLAGLTQEPSGNRSPASAEDCAALAVIMDGVRGRIFSGDTPMAAYSFGVDCDWKALGVAPPIVEPPTPPASGVIVHFLFSHVGPDTGENRSFQLTVSGRNLKGPGGFGQVYQCTANKLNGKWGSTGCKATLFAD